MVKSTTFFKPLLEPALDKKQATISERSNQDIKDLFSARNSLQRDSNGYVVKYKHHDLFYKTNNLKSGYKQIDQEIFVTKLLDGSDFEYVKYWKEQAIVHYRGDRVNTDVCVCKNFLDSDEVFIDALEVLEFYNNVKTYSNLDSGLEKYNLLVDCFIQQGLLRPQIVESLSFMICLDFLLLNPDRHLGNFGIILNPFQNSLRMAPIFDNGEGLYCSNMFMQDIECQPFCNRFSKQIMLVDSGILKRFLNHLSTVCYKQLIQECFNYETEINNKIYEKLQERTQLLHGVLDTLTAQSTISATFMFK